MDKINNKSKRNNSPINLKVNYEDKKDEDIESDKSNSSINGVQKYKLDKFSDDEEEYK